MKSMMTIFFTLALSNWSMGMSVHNWANISLMSGEAEFEELEATTDAYESLVVSLGTSEV